MTEHNRSPGTPAVHEFQEVMERVAICATSFQKGVMHEGCEGVDAELIDKDGDGNLEVTIVVSAEFVTRTVNNP